MVNDLISDSLTRIRNAQSRKLATTTLLHSKIVESVVGILEAKGYVKSHTLIKEGNKKFIKVTLAYDENGIGVINEVKRVSKPGRRVYKPKDEVKRFKNGYGSIILSTSSGVIDNDKAKELSIGGEVLCTVW